MLFTKLMNYSPDCLKKKHSIVSEKQVDENWEDQDRGNWNPRTLLNQEDQNWDDQDRCFNHDCHNLSLMLYGIFDLLNSWFFQLDEKEFRKKKRMITGLMTENMTNHFSNHALILSNITRGGIDPSRGCRNHSCDKSLEDLTNVDPLKTRDECYYVFYALSSSSTNSERRSQTRQVYLNK